LLSGAIKTTGREQLLHKIKRVDYIVHNDEEVELALVEEKKKKNNYNTDMMYIEK
jgi:hypothetical protein